MLISQTLFADIIDIVIFFDYTHLPIDSNDITMLYI